MSKIYVPNYTNNSCVHILDKDTIRVYEITPTNDSYIAYVDYYINSHYLSVENLQYFDTNDNIPTCENISNITNEFYYRNDLIDILCCFIIICIFAIYMPYKIISRAFGRWLKL